jgi:hypothetical protein
MAYKSFEVYQFAAHAVPSMEKFASPAFIAKQMELRQQHDNIQMEAQSSSSRAIQGIDTPFVVRVTYHRPGLRTWETNEIRNVIYSLDPTLFGLEVIWLCTFALRNGEYLIDGEYHLSREVLIRRPVVLLNMEYLRQVYERAGTLGAITRSRDSAECKVLSEVTKEDCVVFDVDVELRRNRLQAVKQELSKPRLSGQYRRNLKWESKLIESWLSEYGRAFEEAHVKGLKDERLRTLCPVTWKALEMVFAHQIDYQK